MNEDRCTDQIHQLIERAIELIREYGWIRYANSNQNGYCMDGALAAAARENLAEVDSNEQRYERYRQLSQVRQQVEEILLSRCHASIIDFNDDICRDADEAIEVLKLANDLSN